MAKNLLNGIGLIKKETSGKSCLNYANTLKVNDGHGDNNNGIVTNAKRSDDYIVVPESVLTAKIHDTGRQMLDGKLVLVENEGVPLKPVNVDQSSVKTNVELTIDPTTMSVSFIYTSQFSFEKGTGRIGDQNSSMGHNIYVRAMIEIDAHQEMIDTLVVVVLIRTFVVNNNGNATILANHFDVLNMVVNEEDVTPSSVLGVTFSKDGLNRENNKASDLGAGESDNKGEEVFNETTSFMAPKQSKVSSSSRVVGGGNGNSSLCEQQILTY
nr:hypothetical protein [Tanacetum cinerariifolium]